MPLKDSLLALLFPLSAQQSHQHKISNTCFSFWLSLELSFTYSNIGHFLKWFHLQFSLQNGHFSCVEITWSVFQYLDFSAILTPFSCSFRRKSSIFLKLLPLQKAGFLLFSFPTLPTKSWHHKQAFSEPRRMQWLVVWFFFFKPARLFSTLSAFMEWYSVELIYKERSFRMFKYLPVFLA